MVSAVIELVKNIIEFVVLLYILFVPSSLIKMVGLVTDVYECNTDTESLLLLLQMYNQVVRMYHKKIHIIYIII